MHKIMRADVSFNLFLCFLITNDALENNLSAGIEVAVIPKISLAIVDKVGYVTSFSFHQLNTEVSFDALGTFMYVSNS